MILNASAKKGILIWASFNELRKLGCENTNIMSRKHTDSADKSRSNSYQHLLKDKTDPDFYHSLHEKNETIKHKMEEFFESHLFHLALFVLLGIDLSIVMFEIILILLYCDNIPHDLHALSQDLVYISIGIIIYDTNIKSE